MNDYGKKAVILHLKYIERNGVEKDGSEGKLYGKDNNFDRDQFKRDIPDEKHQFRFIVSPEDGHALDLTEFTKNLMQQVEKDLIRPLEWAAVNHYNTDNPHVHIVIRGVDLRGERVTIEPKYISEGVRFRAQEIATKELGIRTPEERLEKSRTEIHAEKYTTLDWTLSQKVKDGIIDLGEYSGTLTQQLKQAQLSARLDKLELFGFAEQTGERIWSVREGWQESLRKMGKDIEIYKNIHKVAQGDPQRYRINPVGEKEIQGVVLSKALSNELYDSFYIIVQEPDGYTNYLNLDRKNEPEINVGNVVSITTEKEKWLKKADIVIAQQAAQNNGIYSAKLHLESIDSPTVTLRENEKQVAAEDFVQAHERRLWRLQKFRLAQSLPDESWQVDPELVEKLSEKDKNEGPIVKLRTKNISEISINEQVSYRGRTWLDRFTDKLDSTEFSYYGIGLEMKTAVQRRILILREMGVDPMDPARAKKLDSIEKKELSDRVSQSGLQHKTLHSGEQINGIMREIKMAGGNKYAMVETNSKEFSLVPWHKDFVPHIGKQVELINNAGRYMARGISKSLGR